MSLAGVDLYAKYLAMLQKYYNQKGKGKTFMFLAKIQNS